MTQAFDICIRGAGIVGRSLALLLARERLHVGLVQSAPLPETGATDVRAYALNAASKSLIDSLRAWPEPQQATPVRSMRIQSDGGGQVEFSAEALGVPALAWIVDVPALESRLAQAVSFQSLIEPLAGPEHAALTVVCEGKASRSRAEFGVQFSSTPYFQTAVATRVQCERPHGQVAYQWFAKGEILAFLPLDGEQGNSVAVVWSVDAGRASSLLALDPQDFARQLHEASHGTLGQLALSSERAAWPLVSAQAQRWVGAIGAVGGPAWALAGDAAHAVHPLAGQGLNLGLADVAELARVLREREYWRAVSDLKLLRRYERARSAALLAMGGAMDGLQQMLTREDAPVQALRTWGMRGFDNSGPLKRWVAQRAMGLP
jgi:2-polyprenyl-6-methoxyphenol hydroxylase-like FAD-dependent oxidoreductase